MSELGEACLAPLVDCGEILIIEFDAGEEEIAENPLLLDEIEARFLTVVVLGFREPLDSQVLVLQSVVGDQAFTTLASALEFCLRDQVKLRSVEFREGVFLLLDNDIESSQFIYVLCVEFFLFGD